MIVNVVTVHVKPEHLAEFLAATVDNHKGSRTEPGNHRFDVLQSADDPCRILLYEVFASPEAVEAHRQTAHYLAWQSKVADWMAKPRERASHRVIAPADPAAW
ncbi:MAG TPA: putative quinol monooxygenase [Fibrobacteria bacterium]|nr:putative quinol monooxygenase [Fibrobacteria bacterium]